jgi:hypothetical protein
MRGIWTTLSADTRVSNGNFPGQVLNGRLRGTTRMEVSMGRLEWKFPADVSVRTAEIGGRRRQAQDDHQGRVGRQLAVGEFADSRPDPLLGKTITERLGEKVCR